MPLKQRFFRRQNMVYTNEHSDVLLIRGMHKEVTVKDMIMYGKELQVPAPLFISLPRDLFVSKKGR